MLPGSRTLPYPDSGLPTLTAARAQPDAHHGPQPANGCQDPTSQTRLDARLKPPWTDIPTTPGCRCLTAPAPLEGSRIQGPGITGLASSVELPLIEQFTTGQEARRRRPSPARPHVFSSTSQDSWRLGREPKTNLKSLDPELDQRSTPDSIHRSLNTIHGTRPPQPSVMVSQTCGPGRRHNRETWQLFSELEFSPIFSNIFPKGIGYRVGFWGLRF
jgi:hypothetical protein